MAFTAIFTDVEPTRAEIDAVAEPLVLEFGTDWCPHCRAAQPLIAEAFSAFPGIRHVKVMDGPGQPLGRSFRVTLWPTLIFLDHGREAQRLVRPTSAGDIRTALAGLKR